MAAISQTTFSKSFTVWKLLYFDSYFKEICSQGYSKQNTNIASDNDLNQSLSEPLVAYSCIYAPCGHNETISSFSFMFVIDILYDV